MKKKKSNLKKKVVNNINNNKLNIINKDKTFVNLLFKIIFLFKKNNFLNISNNSKLFKFLLTLNWNNKGIIYKNIDGVASIKGLFKAPMLGILKFAKLNIFKSGDSFKYKLSLISNVMGLVLTLNNESVLSFIIGNERKIKPLHIAILDRKIPMIQVNKNTLGSVVNSLGVNLDNKIVSNKDIENILLENEAPGIIERSEVNEKLLTGLKSVDSMIPIGKGQRELIIGDRQTGKTAIALDTILNQNTNIHLEKLPRWALDKDSKINVTKDKKKELKSFYLTKPEKLKSFYKKKRFYNHQVYSIYVGIGQKSSSIAQLSYRLHLQGALENSVIVAANASDSAALQYLAPYTGCAIGEWLSVKGFHSLVIYDDLSKHAVAYRQMALLLRRSPGREAYPGDVFYLHSRLLERATKFNLDNGFGSLTALPVIETQAGDVSAYIPTNVISITDGQIFLETILFNRGIRPAINVGISVSRIGSKAQTNIMKTLAGTLKLDLAQYREVEYFANFGSSLDKTTQMILHRGERLVEILKQDQFKPLRLGLQIWILYCAMLGFIDKISPNLLKLFESVLLYITTLKEEGLVITEIFEEQYKFNSKVLFNNNNDTLENVFKYWIVVFLNFFLKKIIWKLDSK